MTSTIPIRPPSTDPDRENQRLMAAARAALDALLAQVTRRNGRFYGKIAVEITVQNSMLGHVKEIVERTRK